MRSPLLPIGLLVSALAAILLATLVPVPVSPAPWMDCLFCSDTITADAVLNVILFAPLGIFAAVVGWGWGRILLAGGLLSAAIELAQLVIPGRDASIADVLFNVIGVAVGVAIVRSAGWWLRPADRLASRLALAAALLVIVVFGFTAYLFHPVLPPGQYAAQWTGNFAGLELYQGRVLEATLGEIEVPGRALDDSDTIRALLRAGAPLRVRLVAGPTSRGLAPIFTVTDPTGWRIAFLGVDRDDLLFMYEQRASLLKLYDPDPRVRDGMRSVEAGDTITLEAIREPDRYCLGVDAVAWCDLGPPTVGAGWAMFHGDRYPGWLKTGLNVVWVACLLLPFGFWTRSRLSGAVGSLAIAAALLLVPALSELGASGLADWLGALIGLAVGQLLQRLVGRVGGAAG